MNGPEFERSLAHLFIRLGCDAVELIGGYRDNGADLIVTFAGARTAVQAKRSKGLVRKSAVLSVVDGRQRWRCDRGMVVTNAFFSRAAEECAAEWDVGLWDRAVLADMFSKPGPRVDHTRCAECGIAVSFGVTRFCLRNRGRFGGLVFCMSHQKRQNRAA